MKRNRRENMFDQDMSACKGETYELPFRQPRYDGILDLIKICMFRASKEKGNSKVSRGKSGPGDRQKIANSLS